MYKDSFEIKAFVRQLKTNARNRCFLGRLHIGWPNLSGRKNQPVFPAQDARRWYVPNG
jgi:hypothetical protein